MNIGAGAVVVVGGGIDGGAVDLLRKLLKATYRRCNGLDFRGSYPLAL
jgi:hypothetical protein